MRFVTAAFWALWLCTIEAIGRPKSNRVSSITGAPTITGTSTIAGTSTKYLVSASAETSAVTGTSTKRSVSSSTETSTKPNVSASTGISTKRDVSLSTGTSTIAGTSTKPNVSSSTGTSTVTGTSTKRSGSSSTGTSTVTGTSTKRSGSSSTGTSTVTGTSTERSGSSSTGTSTVTGTSTKRNSSSSAETSKGAGTSTTSVKPSAHLPPTNEHSSTSSPSTETELPLRSNAKAEPRVYTVGDALRLLSALPSLEASTVNLFGEFEGISCESFVEAYVTKYLELEWPSNGPSSTAACDARKNWAKSPLLSMVHVLGFLPSDQTLSTQASLTLRMLVNEIPDLFHLQQERQAGETRAALAFMADQKTSLGISPTTSLADLPVPKGPREKAKLSPDLKRKIQVYFASAKEDTFIGNIFAAVLIDNPSMWTWSNTYLQQIRKLASLVSAPSDSGDSVMPDDQLGAVPVQQAPGPIPSKSELKYWAWLTQEDQRAGQQRIQSDLKESKTAIPTDYKYLTQFFVQTEEPPKISRKERRQMEKKAKKNQITVKSLRDLSRNHATMFKVYDKSTTAAKTNQFAEFWANQYAFLYHFALEVDADANSIASFLFQSIMKGRTNEFVLLESVPVDPSVPPSAQMSVYQSLITETAVKGLSLPFASLLDAIYGSAYDEAVEIALLYKQLFGKLETINSNVWFEKIEQFRNQEFLNKLYKSFLQDSLELPVAPVMSRGTFAETATAVLKSSPYRTSKQLTAGISHLSALLSALKSAEGVIDDRNSLGLAELIVSINPKAARGMPITNWVFSEPRAGITSALLDTIRAELDGMERSKKCSDQAIALTLAWLLPTNAHYFTALMEPYPPTPVPDYPDGMDPGQAPSDALLNRFDNVTSLQSAAHEILGPLLQRKDVLELQSALYTYDSCSRDSNCKQKSLSKVFSLSVRKVMNDFDLVADFILSSALSDRDGSNSHLYQDLRLFSNSVMKPYGVKLIDLALAALHQAATQCPWIGILHEKTPRGIRQKKRGN